MSRTTFHLPQPLADGLCLRQATADDTSALVEFNTRIHSAEDGIAVREMLSPTHPRMGPANFLIIEDLAAGNCIVGSACLIPETWAYAGIPFEVGMPEFVGTDPAYRRRGLMRMTMDALHRISAARNIPVQAVHGVPWFYRRFGYEYVLTFWEAFALPLHLVPLQAEGGADAVQIRLATSDDASSMARLHTYVNAYAVVTTQPSEAEWHYRLGDTSRGSYTQRYFMVLDPSGNPIGYYRTSTELHRNLLFVPVIILDDTISLYEALPPITRALKSQGEAYAAEQGSGFDAIVFSFSSNHAAHDVLKNRLYRGRIEPLYMRVADLAAFMQHIAPALEQRLITSAMHGFSGELRLNFYQEGMRLLFAQGKLTAVEAIAGHVGYGAVYDGAFPPLVFLKLLFCHRSLAELLAMFPDCQANEKAMSLLNALFPKQDTPVNF